MTSEFPLALVALCGRIGEEKANGKGRCQVLGAGFRGKQVVRSYKDLQVWQRAMDLVVESYRLAALLPKTETYGLSSQIRRAAVSVPANIAEGHGREHLGEYLHHLSVANGSLMELETHILVAGRLGFLQQDQMDRILGMTGEVGRILAGLIRSLKKKP